MAFHDLGSENYAEALTTYLARYRDVARDEVVASPKDFRMQVKEHVENCHSETRKELTGIPSQVMVANEAARDSDEDVHVMETKVIDACPSVVDELLAQWTIL